MTSQLVSLSNPRIEGNKILFDIEFESKTAPVENTQPITELFELEKAPIVAEPKRPRLYRPHKDSEMFSLSLMTSHIRTRSSVPGHEKVTFRDIEYELRRGNQLIVMYQTNGDQHGETCTDRAGLKWLNQIYQFADIA